MITLILRKKFILKQRCFFDGTLYVKIPKNVPKTYFRYRCSKIPIPKIQYRYFWVPIPKYRISCGTPSFQFNNVQCCRLLNSTVLPKTSHRDTSTLIVSYAGSAIRCSNLSISLSNRNPTTVFIYYLALATHPEQKVYRNSLVWRLLKPLPISTCRIKNYIYPPWSLYTNFDDCNHTLPHTDFSR